MNTPNFIVFLTDDQAYGDLSCMGATDFRTLHLDRMAVAALSWLNSDRRRGRQPGRRNWGGLSRRRKIAAQADPLRREYLSSFAIACDAAGLLLGRYATLAGELVEKTDDPARRSELARIADVCAHLVTGAPRDAA